MRVWLIAALLITTAAARAETYCFGFLNAHPERKPLPEAEAQEIQKGHLAHMEKMSQQGHLLAAGPMATPGGPRGILIYRCKSLEEARGWTAGDPAVQNKRLTLDVHRWNGPNHIGEPLMSKLKADPKAKYNMVQLPFFMLHRTERFGSGPPNDVIAEHLQQVKKLIGEGTIRAAGPFTESPAGSDLIGVFVFAEMPLEQAKALAEKDALVRGGFARLEPHMWYVADEVIPKKVSAQP